jgi:hypothetical protein
MLYLHRLSPGNGVQRCSFFSFRAHVRTDRRLSHNSLTPLLTAVSRLSHNQSQSENYFTTGELPPIQFALATSPVRLTTSSFIFQLNTCGYPYLTSSLKRGWVCRLQLLMLLASAVILRSGYRGIRDHIDSRLPQPGGPTLSIYIPQEQGSPIITPGTEFLFIASCASQGCSGGRYLTPPPRAAAPRYISPTRISRRHLSRQFCYCFEPHRTKPSLYYSLQLLHSNGR